MEETRWAGRTHALAAGAFLLLVLLLQGCDGEAGSQGVAAGSSDSAVGGAAGQEPDGGAEMAVAQESGPITDETVDRKVVKTAELSVRSEDVRGSAEEARRVAEKFGGEVLSSMIYAGSGPVKADLVLSARRGSSRRRSTSCAAWVSGSRRTPWRART